MKTTYLILCILFLFILNGYSQSKAHLLIDNKIIYANHIIKEGEEIKIKDINDLIYQGKIGFCDDTISNGDSTILIGNVRLYIKDIVYIKTRSRLFDVGTAFTVLGSTMLLISSLTSASNTGDLSSDIASYGGLCIGPLISGIGVIMLTSKDVYRSKRYDFSVVRDYKRR